MHRRRRRDARLADRAAGAALEARRPRREGPHPVPRPAPASGRREPRLVGDPHAGAPAPGDLGRRVRRRAARARRAGAAACTPRSPGLDSLPQERCRRSSTLDRLEAAFPGDGRARRSSRSRPTPTPPAFKNAVNELRAKALDDRRRCTARSTSTSTRRTRRRGSRSRSTATASTRRRTRRSPRSATTCCRRRIGQVPGATYAVTGGTAASYDANQAMKHSAPLVFGFVLAVRVPAPARRVPLDRDRR